MNTRLSAFLLGLLLAGPLAAQTSPSHSLGDYDFQVARAPSNRVVHYLKSNLDGSNRMVISIHFAAPLKLEVLKVEADGRYLALVAAEIDPVTLTETQMRSYNQLEQGAPRLQMMLRGENQGRRLVASVAKAELPVEPGHLPAHVYNFDLTGLNATLPHLKNLRRDFEVGIVDPDFQFLAKQFKPDGGVQQGGMVYKGKARFRYLKDEILDEVPCLRYEVGGPAFQDIKGSLWINARDGLIERFDHALPDNPQWSSFKLSRLGARSMDLAGWERFKAATVQRAMELRDAD